MKSSVITEIVENNLCIGCGLCAAICPEGIIKMQWNQYGEFNPAEVVPCILGCGLCLKVCPFADNDENEDTLGDWLYGNNPGNSHRSETGYFSSSFVGYANGEYRVRGSSGGMVTWLLEKLLTEGIVDHAVCVSSSSDPTKLFDFRVFDIPQEVRLGAGSTYYPVEMSEVIRYILQTPGQYAITGLPCFIKAIRLAQKRNKLLKDRIVICIGLICGQMKTSHYTSYIAQCAGLKGRLTKANYRGKKSHYPTSNYYYSFEDDTGNKGEIFWNNGISEAWLNRWFTPNPCNYCDDVFAECADVAFMDAWLPEYSNDSQGTNIVLVRSQLVRDVIDRGIKDQEIILDPIMIEKVVQSQAGVVDVKRRYLSYQLFLGHQRGLKIPNKRVAPFRLENPYVREEIYLKNRMQVISHECWDPNAHDAERLREEMKPHLRRLSKLDSSSSIAKFHFKVIRYFRRKIRSFMNG